VDWATNHDAARQEKTRTDWFVVFEIHLLDAAKSWAVFIGEQHPPREILNGKAPKPGGASRWKPRV